MKNIKISFDDGIGIIKHISNLYNTINKLNKELKHKQEIIDTLLDLINNNKMV